LSEIVTFTAPAPANWSVSSGSPAKASQTSTFVWEAPDKPTTTTITATLGNPAQSCSTAINTIAPAFMSMGGALKLLADQPIGLAGAEMFVDVTLGPLSVSFSGIEWRELRGPATNVTGYFVPLDEAGDLVHKAAPKDARIGPDNSVAPDHVGYPAGGPPPLPVALPEPWSKGTFEWHIPNQFRKAGSQGAGSTATTLESFTIARDGTVTVSKQGATVTRHMNESKGA